MTFVLSVVLPFIFARVVEIDTQLQVGGYLTVLGLLFLISFGFDRCKKTGPDTKKL